LLFDEHVSIFERNEGVCLISYSLLIGRNLQMEQKFRKSKEISYCWEKIKNVMRGKNTQVAAKEAKKRESAWTSPWALTRVSIRMEKRLQCERGSARIRGRNYHRVALAHNFSILDDNFSLLLGSCLTINMN